MVESEILDTQLRKSASDSCESITSSFITTHRAAKLELLIHLLTNSSQPIVICGPYGVGKSTLLKFLLDRNDESWVYCLVKGKADVNFEMIQDHLVQSLKDQQFGNNAQSLKEMLVQVKRKNKKLVLLIDDAGNLVPGLINMIIQHYASSKLKLKVVFALTHDEMSIKISSDRTIDDCNFIEIPGLSKIQCGEFLRILSTHSFSHLPFNAINDSMVELVYRETHGIPGRVIEQLPLLMQSTKRGKSRWIIVLVLIALCALTYSLQWFNFFENNDIPKPEPVQIDQKAVSSPLILPKVSTGE